MSSPCLPAEVWTLVFRLLSLSDRLRVRASCTYFRDLVDDALWRNRTVRLKRGEEYEEDFWSSLRRWRVTSAWMPFHIKLAHIAKELPGLTTLIIHGYRAERRNTDMQIQDLKSFSNLERLHLTLPFNVRLEELSPALPQRLAQLRVCQKDHNTYLLPPEIPPDSPFKKLKSLVFHCMFDSHPVNVLHFFLSSLPQLQHLSIKVFVYRSISFEGHISDLAPLHNCSLSSLELLDCETKKFPMDMMKMVSKLPFLQSLAISCQHDEDDDCYYCYKDQSDKLSAWLGDLPTLTCLTVEGCIDFGEFVGSIPSSVTRLTLQTHEIDSDAFAALSAQLPNLRHLTLEVLVTCDPEMDYDDPPLGPCSEMALIPQLFPRLKTLRLLHYQVSDDVFLSLASLKELEVLEIMEVLGIDRVEPLPDALVSKLRELTNNRVRIYKKPEEQWKRHCGCFHHIPTDDWE